MKRRVLLQLFLTITVACIISSGFYFVLCRGLRKTTRDNIGKFNFLLSDTTRYNTVFFGASSTHTGVNPVLFDSLTGTHSFNAGMDGVSITELNLIISKYIKSHGAPRNIFIILDETTLLTDIGIWYFPQYFPYIHDPDFKEFIYREPKLLLGRYAAPAALTFMDDPLKNLGLIALMNVSNKAHQLTSIRGFLPLREPQVVSAGVTKHADHFSASAEGLDLLRETLHYCEKHGCRVWLTNAPRYNLLIPDSDNGFFRKLDSLALQYRGRIIIINNDERLVANYLFVDERHLNSSGADIYTSILASQFMRKKP